MKLTGLRYNWITSEALFLGLSLGLPKRSLVFKSVKVKKAHSQCRRVPSVGWGTTIEQKIEEQILILGFGVYHPSYLSLRYQNSGFYGFGLWDLHQKVLGTLSSLVLD